MSDEDKKGNDLDIYVLFINKKKIVSLETVYSMLRDMAEELKFDEDFKMFGRQCLTSDDGKSTPCNRFIICLPRELVSLFKGADLLGEDKEVNIIKYYFQYPTTKKAKENYPSKLNKLTFHFSCKKADKKFIVETLEYLTCRENKNDALINHDLYMIKPSKKDYFYVIFQENDEGKLPTQFISRLRYLLNNSTNTHTGELVQVRWANEFYINGK